SDRSYEARQNPPAIYLHRQKAVSGPTCRDRECQREWELSLCSSARENSCSSMACHTCFDSGKTNCFESPSELATTRLASESREGSAAKLTTRNCEKKPGSGPYPCSKERRSVIGEI